MLSLFFHAYVNLNVSKLALGDTKKIVVNHVLDVMMILN